MGVAIDQPRRDPAALAVGLAAKCAQRSRHFVFRPGVDDAPVADRDRSALDRPESGPMRRQRREARIAPQAVARCRLPIEVWRETGHDAFLSAPICIDLIKMESARSPRDNRCDVSGRRRQST
jgi:hypothetical protein